ncbi:MAG: hypothetical protein ACHQJ4_04755 [Ignavibacteria bacterium]
MKTKANTYSILGKTYEAKPLKLQLNKNSFSLIRELNEYIKSETELTAEEMKNPEYSLIISLAITGFISNEMNCARVLDTFLEGNEDWSQVIRDNQDKFGEIKISSIKILNDFFLNVLKLTRTYAGSYLSLKNYWKIQK